MNPPGCEEVRASVAELALGIADGEERARALEHVAACPGCREQLREMAEVADELLILAPPAEPPVGFEGRVSEALAPRSPRRWWARPRFAVAAAAGVALAAAAAVWIATAKDRDLAGEYRQVLAVAHGSYFEASDLDAPGGDHVGYVYGYQGKTSWALTVVYGVPDGRYRLVAAGPGDGSGGVARVDVSDGRGTAGGALPGAYENITELRLLDEHGREVADAELNRAD